MKYGLTIVQRIEDEEGLVVAVDAQGFVQDCQAELTYSFDDADYELKISDGKIFQKRTGDVNISMLFIKDKRTVCSIEDGALSGDFTVYTRRLEISGKGAYIKAFCAYTDCQDSDETKLEINITPLND